MIDRSDVEARPDVLVYTGSALDNDLEVTGPIQVRLFAASSARDTDFTAALTDVFPDGQCSWCARVSSGRDTASLTAKCP